MSMTYSEMIKRKYKKQAANEQNGRPIRKLIQFFFFLKQKARDIALYSAVENVN